MNFPAPRYSVPRNSVTQTVFKGYNHTPGAGDGEIYDMQNMSSDLFPVMSPRKPRYKLRKLSTPNGIYARDGLYTVDGTTLYKNTTVIGSVANSRKTFASLGSWIIILPDKKAYNVANGTFKNIESSRTGAIKITDGLYAGQPADANTIYAADVNWGNYFSAGDAVTISGCTVHPANNRTSIIREISGSYLRFYENVFTINDGGDTESSVTIARTMPDLDFICENENRLWGCKGTTIYASKLGDPFNWNVFDGLASDSYAVDVGSAGDFTACVSYLGYPVFFKQDHIYKVYGSKPANFQVMGSATLGVLSGCEKSLAVAGETLYYMSRAGIVAYSGGTPTNVSEAFGEETYDSAVAGSDGAKYYISAKNSAGQYSLFVLDTERGLWHREDSTHAVGIVWNNGLHLLTASGELFLCGSHSAPAGSTAEAQVESYAEFSDFAESPKKKYLPRIQLRAEIDEGAEFAIFVMYDSDGTWRRVYTASGSATKRSYNIPVRLRRCDHFRLRFEGMGGYRIYSLSRDIATSSERI